MYFSSVSVMRWCEGIGYGLFYYSRSTRKSQGKWSDMCFSSPISPSKLFPTHPPANWQEERERERIREGILVQCLPYRSYSAQLYPIVDREVHSTTHTRIKTPNYTHTPSTEYTLRYIHSRSDAGRDGAGCEKCLFCAWVGGSGRGGGGQKARTKRQKGRGSLSLLHYPLSLIRPSLHPRTLAHSRIFLFADE